MQGYAHPKYVSWSMSFKLVVLWYCSRQLGGGKCQ